MAKSKVLLPTDGSAAAIRAAVYAARLMKLDSEMEVCVLVVVPPEGSSLGEDVLQKTVDVFLNQGLTVQGCIKFGDPAEIILSEAKEGGYDHIIMGSRGAGEVKDSGIGSVSHRVVNSAFCRVTLVK